MLGILNINKEEGYTSADVVHIVRKTLAIAYGYKEKVGHTGTLDPMATGVLPVCVGRATKLADLIMSKRKVYKARVRLGIATDTGDITGTVLEEASVQMGPELMDEIHRVASSFLGKSLQIPPMYSALKVNGKRLYALAREGLEVERQAREIEIFDLKITDGYEDGFTMLVDCSKGTYIRSLAEDIGKKLGFPACLQALERTATGRFTLDSACKLDQFKAMVQKGRLSELLLPVDTVLDYPRLKAKQAAQKFLENGNKIGLGLIEGLDEPTGLEGRKSFDSAPWKESLAHESDFAVKDEIGKNPVFIYDYENRLVGIYKANQRFFEPELMLL